MAKDVFSRLRTSKDLTDTDRAIVDYVLDHADEIGHLTSRELATLTNTSSSAVTRACRRLGFSGFNDLKLNIAADLKRTRPGTTALAPNERALAAAAKLCELEVGSLLATRQAMDLDAMQRAADLLAQAEEVDVCGIGSNAAHAHYAAKIVTGAGTFATVQTSADAMAYYAELVPQNHAALVISRGGRDSAIVALLDALAKRGTPSVLVTCDVDSPGAERATVALGCHYGSHGTIGEMVFATTARYVLDTLCAMLLSGDIPFAEQLYDETSEALATRFLGTDAWDFEAMSSV